MKKRTVVFIFFIVATIFLITISYEEYRIKNLYEVIQLREDSVEDFKLRSSELEEKLKKIRQGNTYTTIRDLKIKIKELKEENEKLKN